MKKILSMALCLTMLCSMCVTGFADTVTPDSTSNEIGTAITYGVEDSYTVSIPNAVAISHDTANAAFDVKVSDLFIPFDSYLQIYVGGDSYQGGYWHLQNVNNAAAALRYTISAGNALANGDTVLSISGSSGNNTTKTTKLTARLIDKMQEPGQYADNITFTIALTANYSLEAYNEIATTLNGKPIVSVDMSNCTKMTRAPKIPDTVTTLSFKGCSALTYAPVLPSNIVNLDSCFQNCTRLSQAPAIPAGVTSMVRTFAGCTNLWKAPAIPNGVTNMFGTFFDTRISAAPDIPASVETLDYAFANCVNLTKVGAIGNGVKSMEATFNNCTALKTAPVIPASVTNMANCFDNCTALTGEVTVNCNPTEYTRAFTSAKITGIVGDTTMAEALMMTISNVNTNPKPAN